MRKDKMKDGQRKTKNIGFVESINFDQIFKDILLQIKQRHFILFRINKYQFFISEIAIVKVPS